MTSAGKVTEQFPLKSWFSGESTETSFGEDFKESSRKIEERELNIYNFQYQPTNPKL